MSKVKHNNGKPLTYRFNQSIFSEIEAIQDALMIRSMVKVPDQATISKIRKLSFQASRLKKTAYYNPKLSKLDFNELLNLMQLKVHALERGKAISRGKAIARMGLTNV